MGSASCFSSSCTRLVAVVGRESGAPVVVAVAWRVKLYVGRRLSKDPRLGMKREFCTFVRVDRVEISGSAVRWWVS